MDTDKDMTNGEYEELCADVRVVNEQHIDLFFEDLTKARVSRAKVNQYLGDVEVFLNDYLLRYSIHTMEEGPRMIEDYLGDFFIKKLPWSTPASIKTTAASLKKFYECMLQHGVIPQEDYDFLCGEIRKKQAKWCRLCEEYNTPEKPEIDDPDGPLIFYL